MHEKVTPLNLITNLCLVFTDSFKSTCQGIHGRIYPGHSSWGRRWSRTPLIDNHWLFDIYMKTHCRLPSAERTSPGLRYHDETPHQYSSSSPSLAHPCIRARTEGWCVPKAGGRHFCSAFVSLPKCLPDRLDKKNSISYEASLRYKAAKPRPIYLIAAYTLATEIANLFTFRQIKLPLAKTTKDRNRKILLSTVVSW